MFCAYILLRGERKAFDRREFGSLKAERLRGFHLKVEHFSVRVFSKFLILLLRSSVAKRGGVFYFYRFVF